ncbi:uncharacterized protein LOC126746500 [Anthonomus grandis grandis]|uniref:uncharacterized protein LOC126746500 n=1 Tax=Anthonomus grandis grandis TaxID=2921223 RepID=UPI002165963A|nr:uncharacterized protein LOC126746500 [Anthonomus grandis grandis]XP_050310750.1 uncharacterized protein LOC126746500 [Anthonomus grandis grandis]XP_050310751.1 uncharacterized protein LOC126746500 [Anthonomus grandis grandis]XP_050310752.1 uncharacterized protein LOC126746500 [Anthonomus grandis grandis]
MISQELNGSASKEKDCALDNHVLKQALLMVEVGIELKDRYSAGDKYIRHLKTFVNGAEKAVAALQLTSRSSLDLAEKLLQSNLKSQKLSENLKHEFENLLSVIQREISTMETRPRDEDAPQCEGLNLDQLADKIKSLETRNRSSDNSLVANPSSSKSSKIDINEKYPENLSRESLIDLNNINLPPVPEDIFTSFSNKPIRTSSLSSLKSMRKIKLFLQKAESSDDDESSENDDHDYSRLVYGDSDECKNLSCHSPSSKKLQLGNIKEETQD